MTIGLQLARGSIVTFEDNLAFPANRVSRVRFAHAEKARAGVIVASKVDGDRNRSEGGFAGTIPDALVTVLAAGHAAMLAAHHILGWRDGANALRVAPSITAALMKRFTITGCCFTC